MIVLPATQVLHKQDLLSMIVLPATQVLLLWRRRILESPRVGAGSEDAARKSLITQRLAGNKTLGKSPNAAAQMLNLMQG